LLFFDECLIIQIIRDMSLWRKNDYAEILLKNILLYKIKEGRLFADEY